jgi:hypothetical protein
LGKQNFRNFAVAKTQKKIKPAVVKVELRQKRQQKNRVLPPYRVNLQKPDASPETPFDE